MLKVALKGLAGRKLRAALTAFAVVLGVAMISGTFVLTDTIKAGFSTVFTTVYERTDIVVTGRSALGTNNSNGQNTPPSFSASLLAKVRSAPGVEAAVGGVADQAQLVGRNGKVITFGFAPRLGFSVNSGGRPALQPARAHRGPLPGRARTRSRSTRTRRRRSTTRSAQDDRRRRPVVPVQHFKITGHREARRRRVARRRDDGDLRSAHRAEALRQGRRARRDRCSREAGHVWRHGHRARSARSCRRRPSCEAASSRLPSRRRTRATSRASCRSSCSPSAASRCSSASS